MTEAAVAEPVAEPDDEPTVDVEAILPEPSMVTVVGAECRVRRMLTREVLNLLRVLTSGLGGGLMTVRLDLSDAAAAGRDLAALMLLAAPSAQSELLVFIAGMIEPVNAEDRARVMTYLHENPDPLVLMDIFEAVATAEADSLVEIAGKLQAMWSRIAKVFQK
jgi:hypothetical protein